MIYDWNKERRKRGLPQVMSKRPSPDTPYVTQAQFQKVIDLVLDIDRREAETNRTLAQLIKALQDDPSPVGQ